MEILIGTYMWSFLFVCILMFGEGSLLAVTVDDVKEIIQKHQYQKMRDLINRSESHQTNKEFKDLLDYGNIWLQIKLLRSSEAIQKTLPEIQKIASQYDDSFWSSRMTIIRSRKLTLAKAYGKAIDLIEDFVSCPALQAHT